MPPAALRIALVLALVALVAPARSSWAPSWAKRLPPLAAVLGAFSVATMIAVVMAPWLKDLSTFGFHDWDAQAAHRFLALRSILHYHEFPGWNPFACGGFPAWGYVEADTVVVSPFLPAYALLPLSVAIRVEVAGMAILGAAGAWLAASRFTTSHAARALVAVLWAVNGRWALQAAAGHTWHLAFAWMPWCLYFFERARRRPTRVLDLAGGGVSIAMLVYAGGIYPLPHTVLLLSVYALLLVLTEWSVRPLLTLAAVGVLGVALAAPKLLPLLDGFGKAPRLIESTESLDPGALIAILTSRDQGFSSRPAHVSPYGWHEWGMYISTAGALLLVLGVVFVQGRREAALKGVGVLFFVLGFGAFHPDAPWTLLHAYAPVFRSQHVPSRFLYTAVLVFGIVAAAGVGRLVARRRRRSGAMGPPSPRLDALAAAVLFALAYDIAVVSQKPMLSAMWMVPPDHIPNDHPFHFEQEPPFQYKRRDWAGPMYLAMLGHTGVINCYGAPPFEHKGARPVSAPDYHGEVYVVGEGKAQVVKWSPNRMIAEVEGAAPGALLVYNMNFDDGWRSDAGPVVSYHDALAVQLPAASGRVTFRYRPPYLGTGVLVAALAVGALVWLRRRERQHEG
jgi:hypothetical protein